MSPKAYLYISGTIFAVVGSAHLVRAALGVPVVAGEWEFPMWLSWPGGGVAIILCFWAFRLAGKDGVSS
jgi:hypothetical protein